MNCHTSWLAIIDVTQTPSAFQTSEVLFIETMRFLSLNRFPVNALISERNQLFQLGLPSSVVAGKRKSRRELEARGDLIESVGPSGGKYPSSKTMVSSEQQSVRQFTID